jgi:hypothetical protein
MISFTEILSGQIILKLMLIISQILFGCVFLFLILINILGTKLIGWHSRSLSSRESSITDIPWFSMWLFVEVCSGLTDVACVSDLYFLELDLASAKLVMLARSIFHCCWLACRASHSFWSTESSSSYCFCNMSVSSLRLLLVTSLPWCCSSDNSSQVGVVKSSMHCPWTLLDFRPWATKKFQLCVRSIMHRHIMSQHMCSCKIFTIWLLPWS